MRRSNNFEPKNKQKKLWLVGGVILVIIVLWLIVGNRRNNDSKKDYRFGIINDQILELVSISPERKMVNVAKVNGSVMIWIPGDGEWVPVDQLKKKLESKDNNFKEKVFWFNFGFVPNKIIVSENADVWKSSKVLVSNLGLTKWISFKFNQGQTLTKEEEIKGSLSENEGFLDDMMVRDFADNNLINDETRLSVFNATSESGMANFVSRRLEWSGFSVVSTDNTSRKIDKCLFVYGPKTEQNYGGKMLSKLFDCQKEYDSNLSENEAELYFGENYVSMVKYSSYNSLTGH